MPRPILFALGLVCVAASQAGPAPGPRAAAPPADPIAKLANPKVTESSGLACSRLNPGVIWTHNDSGDGPVLYATDARGADLGEFVIEQALSLDWEDMAAFRLGDECLLAVGDIGDNLAARARVRVYFALEPRVPPAPAASPAAPAPPAPATPPATHGPPAPVKRQQPPAQRRQTLPLLAELELRFEDGPRDCEALAVDTSAPAAVELLLVEKVRNGFCKLYAAPAPDLTPARPGERLPRRSRAQAKAIALVPIPRVTAMDLSADGRWLVVANLTGAAAFERRQAEPWAVALARPPKPLDAPARRQGEAVCFDEPAAHLYFTSEGSPCPLWRLPTPQFVAPQTAAPQPQPRAGP